MAEKGMTVRELIEHLSKLQEFERDGTVYVATVGGGIKTINQDHLYMDDFGSLIIL